MPLEDSSYFQNYCALAASAKLGEAKTASDAEREVARCNERARKMKAQQDRKHEELLQRIESGQQVI